MNKILDAQVSMKEIISLFVAKNEAKDILLKDLYGLFLKHLQLNNRAGTILFYKDHLTKIIDLLEAKKIFYVSEINRHVLNDLAVYYKSKKNCNVTINKKIKALKTMINYAIDNELVGPVDLKFKYLKEQAPKITTVDIQDVDRILKYTSNLKLSSQAMILLYFTTGIRPAELVRIKADHINFNDLTIFLEHTKNGEPRYTPILEPVAEVLSALIATNPKGTTWLFPNEDIRTHVSTEAPRSLIARIKKALKIQDLSATRFRHLFATTLLRQGTDLKSVSKLLGHKSMRITERYLDLTDTEIAAKGRMNNPLHLTSYNS